MSGIPEPTVMPVDRPEWLRRLDLSNFVNAYYEYRDVDSLNGACRVLVVGPGQGLGVQVLRWRGYEVSTLDIDKAFGPDYVGSVYDLSMFGHGQFDVVIASHVLELFAVPFPDRALSEIARVSRWVVIYLPIQSMIRNGTNIGLARSLNVGLAAARGELIARHDADDISDPDRLVRQVAAFNADPDLALIGVQARAVDARGRRMAADEWRKCVTSVSKPNSVDAIRRVGNLLVESRSRSLRQVCVWDKGLEVLLAATNPSNGRMK